MNKNKMKNKFTICLSHLLVPLLMLFLAGCLDTGALDTGSAGTDLSFNDNSGVESEGGSSGTGNFDAGGGSSGTGVTTISQGVVTGFGSIYMNGIVFDTSNAIITIDGVSANETDLRVGMVGRITGEADLDASTGVASSIDILFNVKGPVDEINLAGNSFVVAGQTVVVNPLSVFENATFETLKLGDALEISGLSDMAGGVVYAGYVRVRTSAAEEIKIVGITNNLNSGNKTFTIGSQLINYATAELTGLTEADLIDAMPVWVTGVRDAQLTIIATSIINLTTVPIGEKNDILIVEGIAESTIRQDAVKQLFFEISGITVYLNTEAGLDATLFINGSSSDIGYDTRLKVFGRFISPGVVSADKIEFYVPPNVTVVGNVESITASENQISIAGMSMEINNSTRMLDVSSAALQKFSINDVSVGDQVTAYISKTASKTTALFFRRDAIASQSTITTEKITLRGFANTPNSPAFKLGSIDVDTSATNNFIDPVRGAISQNEFFNAVNGNSIVEAEGIWGNSILAASTVKFINLGNLTVTYVVDGTTAAGSNDFFTVWDGTLNTEEDIRNGSSRENMFISNRQLIMGFEWNVHDIRVFGPGTYLFDSCENNTNLVAPCSIIEMTVAEGQIGAHMLVDWGSEVNIDIVNVWNKNRAFCADEPSSCSVYGSIANPVWDLASSDADGDGVSGITLKDSNFANDLSVNFNLNFR